MKQKLPVRRLWQVDAWRGAALLSMLAFHAMYDWTYLFGHTGGWYDIQAPLCRIWERSICWSFLLLAGFSFSLSRRPLKNALLTGGCAVLLTVVTAVFVPQEAIWFGVLHLIACAGLLTLLLRRALEKVPAGVGLGVCAVLFLLTERLPFGALGFEWITLFRLPQAWYRTNLFWLGLQDSTRFASADYFPLIPWYFLYLCGWFAYRLFSKKTIEDARKSPDGLGWLCTTGQHTLVVYMLHQPVIAAALWAVDTLV
jgi:uncharacterized membrane protein